MTLINGSSPSIVPAVDREPYKLTRNVLVIAPFGGTDKERERRAILDVMRIKYLIEKRVVPTKRGKCNFSLQYKVDKHKADVGPIAITGIQKIANADILVALMTEVNANVAFELAIRNVFRPEVILIVKDPTSVPVYAHDLARIDYKHPTDRKIHAVMKRVMAKHGRSLNWNNLEDVPKELQDALDSIDDRMTEELQGALTQLELSRRPPSLFEEFVRDLDPGRVLGSWNTYIPYAVFRIKWNRKLTGQPYDQSDMDGEPMVESGNEEFKRFINRHRAIVRPDEPGALSLREMIGCIERYMSESAISAFKSDQDRLYSEVILGAGFGFAKVPIAFTKFHPSLPKRRFLPTLLALRTVGDEAHPHSIYLVVAYVERSNKNAR